MKILADFLGGIIGIFTLYFLYSRFLNFTNANKKKMLSIYIVTGLYGMVYPIFALTPFSRGLCTLIYIILPFVIYSNNIGYKIIVGAIYYICLLLSEFFVQSLLLGHLGDFSLFFQAYEYHYFLGVLFSGFLTFFLVYFFTSFTSLSKQKLPTYLYFILFAFPLATSLLFYFLQELIFIVNNQYVYNIYCYITFILLIFNLFILFTVTQISQSSWLKARLSYETQLLQEQQEYHKNLAIYHQKVRQLAHDINNHFLIIQQSLQLGNVEFVSQYIEKHIDSLNSKKMNYTGILLLDSILECKRQIALNQSTQYTIYTEMNHDISIPNDCLEDFALMIASCIDNALEATNQISLADNRWIKITIKYASPYLYCKIENSVHENIKIDLGVLPVTTKSDLFYHGLGLKNVIVLTKKHDGHLFLSCEDYIFTSQFTIKM